MKQTIGNVILSTVVFCVAGPPFGALAFGVWGVALQPSPEAFLGILWVLPFGYFVGLIPAALTGIGVGMVAPRLRNAVAFILASAMIGFLVAGGWAAWNGTGPTNWSGIANFAAMGGFAGLCSGGLVWPMLGRSRAVAA